MFQRIKDMYKSWKYRRRVRRVSYLCGCCCYCPKCDDILNDQAKVDVVKTHGIVYTCSCGHTSHWRFDLAPVPLLVDEYGNIPEES